MQKKRVALLVLNDKLNFLERHFTKKVYGKEFLPENLIPLGESWYGVETDKEFHRWKSDFDFFNESKFLSLFMNSMSYQAYFSSEQGVERGYIKAKQFDLGSDSYEDLTMVFRYVPDSVYQFLNYGKPFKTPKRIETTSYCFCANEAEEDDNDDDDDSFPSNYAIYKQYF